jgi:alpha-L-arabinofuranosidase
MERTRRTAPTDGIGCTIIGGQEAITEILDENHCDNVRAARERGGFASHAGGGCHCASGQAPPPPQQVPLQFFNATRDSKTGTIYVKAVSRAAEPQPVRVQVSGVKRIEPKGQLVTLSGSGPEDTNSITQPAKIVPVTTSVEGLTNCALGE